MNGKVAPTLAGSEALDIQTAMPVVAPVGQANDPFQAHHAAVNQFVGGQEFRIVVKVIQEPAQLPQRALVAVEAGADEAAGIACGLGSGRLPPGRD